MIISGELSAIRNILLARMEKKKDEINVGSQFKVSPLIDEAILDFFRSANFASYLIFSSDKTSKLTWQLYQRISSADSSKISSHSAFKNGRLSISDGLKILIPNLPTKNSLWLFRKSQANKASRKLQFHDPTRSWESNSKGKKGGRC